MRVEVKSRWALKPTKTWGKKVPYRKLLILLLILLAREELKKSHILHTPSENNTVILMDLGTSLPAPLVIAGSRSSLLLVVVVAIERDYIILISTSTWTCPKANIINSTIFVGLLLVLLHTTSLSIIIRAFYSSIWSVQRSTRHPL